MGTPAANPRSAATSARNVPARSVPSTSGRAIWLRVEAGGFESRPSSQARFADIEARTYGGNPTFRKWRTAQQSLKGKSLAAAPLPTARKTASRLVGRHPFSFGAVKTREQRYCRSAAGTADRIQRCCFFKNSGYHPQNAGTDDLPSLSIVVCTMHVPGTADAPHWQACEHGFFWPTPPKLASCGMIQLSGSCSDHP